MLEVLIDDLKSAKKCIKNAKVQLKESYQSNGAEYKKILDRLTQLKKSINNEIKELKELEKML